MLRKSGRNSDARTWARKAYELDAGGVNDNARSIYALALLAPIADNRPARIGAPLDESQRNDLTLATKLLEELWKRNRLTESARLHIDIAVNLINAYRLAGNWDAAARVLEEALAIDPTETHLRAARAAVRFHAGDLKGSISDLDAVPWAPDTALMQAHALWRDGRADAAVKVAETVIVRAKGSEYEKAARITKSEILLAAGNLNDAETFAREIHAAAPLDAEAAAFLAQVLRRKGSKDEALSMLGAVLAHVDGSTDLYDRYLLADQFHQLDAPEVAADLLNGRVSLQRNSEPLRLFIASALEADRRETAKRVIDALDAELSNKPF